MRIAHTANAQSLQTATITSNMFRAANGSNSKMIKPNRQDCDWCEHCVAPGTRKAVGWLVFVAVVVTLAIAFGYGINP
jgi:hypothetical protein